MSTIGSLLEQSSGLFGRDVARELLARWAEPHRAYHGLSHLVDGLRALDELGGARLERTALWFHDAVHTNSTPADEQASAALVWQLLAPHESETDIAEIQRLVLLTAGHHTAAGDGSGQRVCDADLSGLGAEESVYRSNVAGIRAELPQLTEKEWVTGRTTFLTRFLERDRFFGTDVGHARWEKRARANLERELFELRSEQSLN